MHITDSLIVRTPKGEFFREQKYVARCLLVHFLGFVVHITQGVEDCWELQYNQRILRLPNVFFSQERALLWGKSRDNTAQDICWIDVPSRGELARLPIPFALPDARRPEDADIFGSAFFLLTRYEEYISPVKDREGRPDESLFWMRRYHVHRMPLVDDWLDVLLDLLRSYLAPALSPVQRSYQMYITHDIDMPFVWAASSVMRSLLRIGRRTVETRSPVFALQAMQGLWKPEKDPFFTFPWFLAEEEQCGLRSACFFLAAHRHPQDIPYSLLHPALQKLFATLHERGHEIGLHGSFMAASCEGMLAEEATALRQACASPVTTGRQHWLTYDPARTWDIWNNAGMCIDSTLGFPNDVGFRCGTCREFPVFSFLQRKELPLIERPLTVMENALLEAKSLHLSADAAYDTVKDLVTKVRRHGGCFTLLWHNSTLYTAQQRELYCQLLKLCS